MSLLTVVAVLASLYLGVTANSSLEPEGILTCTGAISEMEMTVANLSAEIQTLSRAIASLSAEFRVQILGMNCSHPATSCVEIQKQNSISPSGYYWIRSGNGSAVRMYCDMDRTCRGVTGGWMRVASIDMSSGSLCPGGLREITSPKRLCGINSAGAGCSSAVFSVNGIEYNYVCGRILGYQDKSPDGFFAYHRNSYTIDANYVDGVSITHGRNPRKHIWTLAAANDVDDIYICPCMNSVSAQRLRVPSFVGTDYFCDTAIHSQPPPFRFHPNNSLWDGQQCVSGNGCCTFNGPPWFLKALGSPASDDIEMRLCRDEPPNNEDIPVEIVELFVR